MASSHAHLPGSLRLRPVPTVLQMVVVGALVAGLTWAFPAGATPSGIAFSPYRPEVLQFAASLVLIAVLAGWLRRGSGRSRADRLVDVGFAVFGVAATTWSPSLDLFFHASPGLDVRAVGLAACWALELLLATAAVRLIVGHAVRWPSTVLLGSAVVALLLAEALRFRQLGDHSPVGGPLVATLCSLAGFGLFAAGTLHRSTGDSGTGEYVAPAGARARLCVYLLLSVGGPTVTLLEATLFGFGWRHDGPRAAIQMVLIMLAGTLLVARLGLNARLAHRRAVDMVAQAVALGEALQEQELLQAELSYRASHDPLTSLANRSLLREGLDQVHQPLHGLRHGLLLLDLDGFKDVNDTFGHPVGDALLIEVACRIVAVAGQTSTVARLGGDEFAILIEGADASSVTAVAERTLATVREPYIIAEREICVSTSVGMFVSQTWPAASDALRNADLALYSAKAAGKNRIGTYTPELSETQDRQTRLATGLRHAINRDELTVHYQPVIDLQTGDVVALEALLRWQLVDGSAIPPGEFIPVAEQSALIVEIGTWVLRQAAREACRWYERYGTSITVNVSARQLRDPGFAEIVSCVLAETGLPGHALVLEITETVLVTETSAETDRVMASLGAVRAHGVRIAIDDFGTGYSSLAYLRQLPVDILKIDRTFTAEVGNGQPAFTKAILDLGGSLNLVSIAEAVETREDADGLRRLGCRLAQGYYFFRPLVPEQVDDVLAERNRSGADCAPRNTVALLGA
jgi:diguanylate cyclase